MIDDTTGAREWKVEADGPMTLETAVGDLLALYGGDDQHSPYLFTESRKNVLRIRCRDGTELVVLVDVRRTVRPTPFR